jgi:hypothetical protein
MLLDACGEVFTKGPRTFWLPSARDLVITNFPFNAGVVDW